MYFLKGKLQTPANEIIAGDIGAVSKLQTVKSLTELLLQLQSVKL
jgi:hypothetical protein